MKRLLLPVFLLFTFIAAPAHEESSLDGAWSLKFFPQGPEAVMTPEQADAAEGVTIPATVPGNVEIDRSRAARSDCAVPAAPSAAHAARFINVFFMI